MSDTQHQRLAAVTGITGFIGGHLAARLAASGWRLRVLARTMPKLPASGADPVEVIPGSLSDEGALARLVEGADAVIHLAGAITGRNRAAYMRANAAGTAALARAWRDHGNMSKFVMLSSMAAREPGLSSYAASKAAGEAELPRIGAGRDWVVLRPGAVYGPGDRATLSIFRAAAAPIQPMLNGPGARVTAIHVRDAVRAIEAVAAGGESGVTYELTDWNIDGYSWDELIETAAGALGRAPRALRVPAFALNALGHAGDFLALAGAGGMLTSQKVREILHPDWGSRREDQPPADLWTPSIPLAEGFAETVEWYHEQGWLEQKRFK